MIKKASCQRGKDGCNPLHKQTKRKYSHNINLLPFSLLPTNKVLSTTNQARGCVIKTCIFITQQYNCIIKTIKH